MALIALIVDIIWCFTKDTEGLHVDFMITLTKENFGSESFVKPSGQKLHLAPKGLMKPTLIFNRIQY